MFRLWVREFKETHMLRDIVIEDDTADTRTHKVFKALSDICVKYDLQQPIWLDSNVKEFKRHSKTRFRKDSFVEDVPFDYLEFHVINED